VPKHSTNTVARSGELVPWMAAEGGLAYSPLDPPDSRYFFQYSFHMPDVFQDPRCHHYFGCFSRWSDQDGWSNIGFLKRFWEDSRFRAVEEIIVKCGMLTGVGFLAPIACFTHANSIIAIQNGSYLKVAPTWQPKLMEGHLYLFRGIGEDKEYRQLRIELGKLTHDSLKVLESYYKSMYASFADSKLAFKVAHAATFRTETAFLRDDLSFFDICSEFNLHSESGEMGEALLKFHADCYSLCEGLCQQKFGPNYVKFMTPITNVRLTSFFAGEYEVRVIDPTLLEVIETVGCDVVYEEQV
jgi:hypothetical protein